MKMCRLFLFIDWFYKIGIKKALRCKRNAFIFNLNFLIYDYQFSIQISGSRVLLEL